MLPHMTSKADKYVLRTYVSLIYIENYQDRPVEAADGLLAQRL